MSRMFAVYAQYMGDGKFTMQIRCGPALINMEAMDLEALCLLSVDMSSALVNLGKAVDRCREKQQQ